ncbi:protein of unknown function [Xenorhabdus poinarii G6]|uniref:Uncharacterized protein n=1 Tax=Xenorhabdus poinarii G6 TaxID=1354304 RepID=A0A068QY00_9GAMM|nr:protein of unknown function [Xenorhabdus poinarii G6]
MTLLRKNHEKICPKQFRFTQSYTFLQPFYTQSRCELSLVIDPILYPEIQSTDANLVFKVRYPTFESIMYQSPCQRDNLQ